MKSQLRKITIDKLDYLYVIKNKYQLETQTNTLTLRINLNEYKKTPLIINFLTLDDNYLGQPLNSGIDLTNKKTNTIEKVNLNEPKYIRALILQGINNGWTGKNKVEAQSGLDYLKELGYETSVLQPNKLGSSIT